MKKLIYLALFLFSGMALQAQTDTAQTAAATAAAAVDTGNVVIDGKTLVIIGEGADSLEALIRQQVITKIKADNPQNVLDWVRILLELFASGVLVSIATLVIRYYRLAASMFSKIAKNDTLAILLAGLISGVWTFYETGFSDIQFGLWALRWFSAVGIAVTVYRFIISRFVKTPDPAPRA